MKRSVFLLITAIVTAVFGGMMLFAPGQASATFALTHDPEISIVFRWMGAMILSSAAMNFLVRNDGDSNTLKAVLIFNCVAHALTLVVDFLGVTEWVLEISKLIPGIVVHIFICIGSVIFLLKIKNVTN